MTGVSKALDVSISKVDSPDHPETSVSLYQITRRDIPEEAIFDFCVSRHTFLSYKSCSYDITFLVASEISNGR